MDPLQGSINMDHSEVTPEPTFESARKPGPRDFLASMGALFRRGCCRQDKTEDGYVEFGQTGELETQPGRTLGTFSGVFSPVVLSMFSALLFLRVGFIVGNAGLLITLLQFIIAYGILLFTVSSICAISTNGAVEGGGAYFMISRTLGPDLGGSIGTIFFFANIVSSALYIVGCAESLIENFGVSGNILQILPETGWWKYSYCSALNFINLIVCLIGASMFAKTSVAIFAVVCISVFSVLLSFFIKDPLEVPLPEMDALHGNLTTGNYTGLSINTLQMNMYPNYTTDYSTKDKPVDFAIVFGVLFSGVTGIMAGANMSGELKEPGRSIPWGTISAVLFTLVCYLAVAFLTAASCDRTLLTRNYNYMMPINIIPSFITIGTLTATFSASLSNLIGSSRVLEALAKDNIYGFLLKWIPMGVWRGNPLAAVFTSWFLVQIILLIGSLNLIAQINSVLFLLSYLATNLACLGLDLTSAPNFRPSFKCFSWHTALIGLLGTLVMMFVIDPLYATSSIVLCLLLIVLLHLFSPSSRTAAWGSISQALIFHQVRKYLLMLDSRKEHVKFWRPQVLLLVGNPRSACPLVHFANDMKKSGLYVLGHVIVGKEFSELDSDPTVDQYPHWLSLVDHLKVKAFIELTVARSVREGLHHLVHISGLGAMKPNTIVLGFRDSHQPLDFFQMEGSDYVTQTFERECKAFPLRESESLISASEYTHLIGDILRMGKNVCIARHFHMLYKSQITKPGPYKYIDVWPVNFFQPSSEDPFDTRSSFMLQLACILQMVQSWKHLKLRVLLCEGQASMSDMTEFNVRRPVNVRFQHLLETLRITASIQQVEEWSRLRAFLRNHEVSMDPSSEMTATYINNVNSMIQRLSGETAVTFLYLPPPSGSSPSDYLRLLTKLTHDFRPTLLVHGVRAVTSTTL